MYANGSNLTQQVKQLIARGAELNEMTSYGESALRVASNNGRFDVIKLLLDAGAEAEQLQWTPTFFQTVYGTLDEMRESVQENNDLEGRDYWNRTPWLLSILTGSTEKAGLLLELGADRQAVGRCGKTPLMYAIQNDDTTMLQWLIERGFDLEAVDEFFNTALLEASERGAYNCVKLLLENGADIFRTNHIPERAIQVTDSLDVVKLLVDAGDDINDISSEAHAKLLAIGQDEEPDIEKEEYLTGKHRRFGTANPEKTSIPFWLAMIRCGASAYRARAKFETDRKLNDDPIWCYQRFGRTTSVLDDGRIIEIGGEHEDYYDPDFCIYNDVTVFSADKKEISIYSYPEDVFPPTDFHTATCVNGKIIIIGCLGYRDQRNFGTTPVFALDLKTYQINKVECQGAAPGWISEHKARLTEDKKDIIISGGEIQDEQDKAPRTNIDEWKLDLTSWSWKRLTSRNWPQYHIRREDSGRLHLWELRNLISTKNIPALQDLYEEELQELIGELGREPDYELLEMLYQPSVPFEAADSVSSEYRIVVNDVLVRFKEESYGIRVEVEGELPEETISQIVSEVVDKLSKLEGVPCFSEKLGNVVDELK